MPRQQSTLARRAAERAGTVAQAGPGPERKTMRDLVQQMQGEIARALPSHLDPERFVRILLTELSRNPSLAECTRETFLGAVMTASQLGLEPGVNGECYLVPYRDRRRGITVCQFILGYQGLAKLFWQSPLAAHLDAQAVYERDHFDYAYGLEPRLEHQPHLGADRGEVVAYYAIAALSNGGKAFVVMSPEEVKELRGGKVGSKGDIADPQRWMERKTVLKQALKLMPKAAALAPAIAADEKVRSLSDGEDPGPLDLATYDRVVDGETVPDGVDPTTGEVDTQPMPAPGPDDVPPPDEAWATPPEADR